MKFFMILLVAVVASCSEVKVENSSLKNEYDRNQLLVNGHLAMIDSLTGAIENRDSFSLEKFAIIASQKDSLYKLLDSLFARQYLLDSLMKKNSPS